MKTIGILQARVSSSRLPGKVLLPILGEPMLFRQIERLQRSDELDKVVVATSIDVSDDVLVKECELRSINYIRGSLNDVLFRYIEAALIYKPDVVVRLTGDCPLADPELIDEVIRYFYEGDFDYVSNCYPPTYPDGLDVEVMRIHCLEAANKFAVLPSDREHITTYIRSHPERFKLGNYSVDNDLSHLRWTVDEQEDFKFIKYVYETIYPNNVNFTTEDILRLIESKPEMALINRKYKRNEGLQKSLLNDVEYLKNSK